ncbi:uncharacterized protein LOC110828997 [Zootermopsis nevadensis]|uniref:uncharacterized protein LOC110828997 n=1 Tax=Zootermopsis nevadensis TaxID=136037 RepID=UPI000B8E21EE|nr:uncharacterized protein LOC110828997 [Zootermopsis nevadensis]
MSLATCYVVFVIIAAAAVAAPPGEGTDLPEIKPEEPCSRAGGICLPEKECPVDHLSPKRGLCPEQQKEGVECCHGLSVLERRCSKRGGQCTSKARCGRQLWDNYAQDCSQNEACCILVK